MSRSTHGWNSKVCLESNHHEFFLLAAGPHQLLNLTLVAQACQQAHHESCKQALELRPYRNDLDTNTYRKTSGMSGASQPNSQHLTPLHGGPRNQILLDVLSKSSQEPGSGRGGDTQAHHPSTASKQRLDATMGAMKVKAVASH